MSLPRIMLLEATPPAPAERQKAFAGRANRLSDDLVADLRKRLNEARRKMIEQLAAGGTEWDRHQVPRLRAAVERALADFEAEYRDVFAETSSSIWTEGSEMVERLVQDATGRGAPLPRLDPGQLSVAQELAVGEISAKLRQVEGEIASAIQRGVMGERSPTKIMDEIGKSLDDEGPFRSIAERAEVITRTETNRVFHMAGAERDKQLADPEIQARTGIVMMKRWIATRDARTRASHLAAHGQTVALDEPFLVGGEPLMHPHDPAASAGNVVNCRCTYRRVVVRKPKEIAA